MLTPVSFSCVMPLSVLPLPPFYTSLPFTLFFFQLSISLLFFSLLPLSIPPSPLSVMKLKDGLVLLAYSAACVMNESCPPREREGTVVHTAEYRLMFSYGEGGNGGKMEGEIELKDRRKEGRTNDDGGKVGFGWAG